MRGKAFRYDASTRGTPGCFSPQEAAKTSLAEDNISTLAAVVAGVLAYSIAFFFDWVSMKSKPRVKTIMVVAFLGLHGYGLYAALWRAEQFWIPPALSIVGWIMLPVFAFLLFYSLVVELPSGRTYSRAGVSGQLVKTGTYALTRHPAVLWYILALTSLVLVTRSMALLVAASVWSILNVIYAVVQDKVFFVKMFAGYRQYQKETPMLIPTCKSMGIFVMSLRTKSLRNES